MDYLVSIARVPAVGVQLALIESIQKEHLTRQEARLVVNRLIDIGAGPTDLAELMAEVRRARRGLLGNAVSDTVKDTGSDEGRSGVGSSVYATKPSVDLGRAAKVDPLGEQVGEAQTCGSTEVKDLRPLGEEQALEAGKSPGLDVDAAYGEHGKWKPPPAQGMERWPGVAVREDWLREVEARFEQEEAARIRKALGKVPYIAQDIVPMPTMPMYKGILPQHLPGYLGLLEEATAKWPRLERQVPCSMEQLGHLGQREELKKLGLVPGRFFDIPLNDSYRAVAPHNKNLSHYLDRIFPYRKEEFARLLEAKG